MSTITEDRIQRIEGRVTAVEQAQNDNTQSLRFIVATVAQMKAVQDDHGHQLDDHGRKLDDHGRQLGELRGDVSGLRRDVDGLRSDVSGLRTEVHALRKELPTIVADVMREVLREKR
jgi:DNA-binding FrmR family transcriptional regulator